MTHSVHHPSVSIASGLHDALRAGVGEAEKCGALRQEQLEIIYQQRWFNLFVPQAYGGLGLSFPEALRLQEVLAWTDGSLGWTITLCSGAAWFIGFLEPSAAQGIFGNPNACLAGSGQPSGIAEVTNKGFRINGQWNYATGAPHATVFTANCMLQENGVPIPGDDGQPLMKSFWFHRNEVRVIPGWHTIGMIATASHSFEVKEAIVPASRCFTIDPRNAVLPDAIYQYPFLPFAEATLAVNSSGMATRFMDLCRPSDKLYDAVVTLEQERSSFFRTIDDSWRELLRSRSLSVDTAVAVGRSSRQLASLSLRLVDELYPLCGLEAADTRTVINRVWRDLHTASQHTLLRPST